MKMTATTPAPTKDSRPIALPARQAALLGATRVEQKGNIIVKWITSTDHKTIGYMYLMEPDPVSRTVLVC